jgi:hypothetical protein
MHAHVQMLQVLQVLWCFSGNHLQTPAEAGLNAVTVGEQDGQITCSKPLVAACSVLHLCGCGNWCIVGDDGGNNDTSVLMEPVDGVVQLGILLMCLSPCTQILCWHTLGETPSLTVKTRLPAKFQ